MYSPKGVEFEGVVKALTIETRSGEITILDHHRPLVTILKKGIAVITHTDDKQTENLVHGGFLEVGADNSVTALIDASYGENTRS